MQYVGGLVTIIDIVGEKKTLGYAQRLRTRSSEARKSSALDTVGCLLLFALPLSVLPLGLAWQYFDPSPSDSPWTFVVIGVVLVGLPALGALATDIRSGIAWVFDQLSQLVSSIPRLRFIGLAILTIGFVLDFTAS